jgi:membrane protein implicated in regulation of membrane protease activity
MLDDIVQAIINEMRPPDADPLLGMTGEVVVPIEAGKHALIRVRGELWRATAAHQLPAGARVRVIRIDKLMLHVEQSQS